MGARRVRPAEVVAAKRREKALRDAVEEMIADPTTAAKLSAKTKARLAAVRQQRGGQP